MKKHISSAFLTALLGALLALSTRSAQAASTLYGASWGDGAILQFTSSGVGSVFASSGSQRPSGLAFDSAGNLYAAITDNTVVQFTVGGVGSVFASGLSDPQGLAFDSAGNLYVANYGEGTINMFSSTGTDLGVFASGLSGPQGLAFDSAGNLYVGNGNNNTIVEFTPGGVGSVFASTGLNYPWGLAFGPDTESVPEPSRALLLAAGLGVTVLRRRR